MKLKKVLIPTVVSLVYLSCGRGNDGSVIHEGTRNNITEITSDLIVSIDDKLPILHASGMILAGDTLLYGDLINDEFKFTAYDISDNKTIGRFGKHGSGPGELANFGAIFYDGNSHNLYLSEANQGKVLGFYLPEAISNTEYVPFVKFNMDFNGGHNGYNCPHYINDSTVICSIMVRNPESRSFSTHIGNLNLTTQEVTVIDSLPDNDNISYTIAVSTESDKIFAVGRIQDEIRIYNLKGNLIRTIYGPDNDGRIEKRRNFFANVILCGDKVLAVYAGGSEKNGREIIVMGHDGRYMKTLRFEMPLRDIIYHDKTDRLYISTDDTPQFGYIENFSNILEGKTVAENQSTDQASKNVAEEENVNVPSSDKPVDIPPTTYEDKESNSVRIIMSNPETTKFADGKSTQGPLIFIDANTHGATRTDNLSVGAYPDGDLYRYTIGILNQCDKPVNIKSIGLPDNYFKAEWSMGNILQPNMVGFLYLTCKNPLEEKSYPLIIKYGDNEFPSQILHMTLFASSAQLYNKIHGLE